MHGLTFAGVEKIGYEQVDDPVLIQPGDAIVKISMAGICGSDLHVYHGREKGIDQGTVMGHEFVGTIVETGKDVRKHQAGNRVMSPFTTSCGECYFCRIGLTCRCIKGNLFGWVKEGLGLQGAQAGLIRVPLADSTLVPLSDDLSDEKGLLLGDIFATGYFCADNASISANGVYVVIGCGPVGFMTIIAAKHLGAQTIFVIDQVKERLAKAREYGAIPLDPTHTNIRQRILDHTDGRGVDAVMEVVGSSAALKLAAELVRAGGIISSVGVHTEDHFPFSPVEAYDKNLTYKMGRCPARYYAEKLLKEEIVQRYPIEEIITHRFSLKDGAIAYDMFDKKKDNCIKAVLIP